MLDLTGRHGRTPLLIVVLLSVLLTTAATDPPSAVTTGFPADIDPYQPYEPQMVCDPAPKPGVVDFAEVLLRTYPVSGWSGISRNCGVRGRSEHKEGRAFDWAVSATNPEQRAAAESALGALLATDEHGNAHALFRRLGLMYIIWNQQTFSVRDPEAGWRPYRCNPAAAFDDCHMRHVHFSFSPAGAQRKTTWWTAAPQSTAPQTAAVERIAGALKTDTAIAVSRRAFPTAGSAEQVFLADSGSPHNAMVAAVLAGAFHGSVVLTDGSADVRAHLRAEVARLLGDRPRHQVVAVGESDVLPDTLLDDYRDRYTVRRIGGADLYATASSAAELIEDHGQQKTAVVIGESEFADALPMVAVAAANSWPVLFTPSDELHGDTRRFLLDRNIERVHIAGPSSSVSDAVAGQIAALPDMTVERHSGADQYETAVVVAERFFSLPSGYAVASGVDWADAVVGAGYAGQRRHAPVLLTDGDTLPEVAADYITRSRSPDSAGLIFGGTAVVDSAIERQLRQLLQ